MNGTPYAEVKINARFERGWNTLQAIIQMVVTVIALAGLVGFFGTGPISVAQVKSPDGTVMISYQRVLRRTVQTDMTIHLDQVAGQLQDVTMPETFVQEMDIVSTSPRSSKMQVNADGVSYLFDVPRASSGVVTFSMKPKRFGFFKSRFRIGAQQIAVRQLVWP